MRVVTILLLLLNCKAFANQLNASQNPQPLFLKLGFSSVVEFSENPTRVIVGDSQSFQVEKADKSLVIRTLVSYATTNLFVYFKTAQPKLFTLTASEDANPSLYNKFDVAPLNQISDEKTIDAKSEDKTSSKIVNKKENINLKNIFKSGTTLKSAVFDRSKDYLTIDFLISADGKSLIQPKWDLIRLASGKNKIAPFKVWSEREDIQKDSAIKARLIFLRPDIEKSLKNCYIIIPLKGRSDVFHLNLKKGK